MFWIDRYAIIILIIIAPVVLSLVGLVILTIVRLIYDIYIGIRYGIEAAYKDHENNKRG